MSLVVLLNEEGDYRSALPADIIKGLHQYGYPDYEATAIIQHKRNMYEPAWVEWADLSEWVRASLIKQAKLDVDAALGVPEADIEAPVGLGGEHMDYGPQPIVDVEGIIDPPEDV